MKETMKNLCQESRCPGWDSNRHLSATRSSCYRLSQPAYSHCVQKSVNTIKSSMNTWLLCIPNLSVSMIKTKTASQTTKQSNEQLPTSKCKWYDATVAASEWTVKTRERTKVIILLNIPERAGYQLQTPFIPKQVGHLSGLAVMRNNLHREAKQTLSHDWLQKGFRCFLFQLFQKLFFLRSEAFTTVCNEGCTR